MRHFAQALSEAGRLLHYHRLDDTGATADLESLGAKLHADLLLLKPQRVVMTTEPQPGQPYTIAVLAVNGPLGQPGGGVFVRYAFLALEWRTPGY